MQRLITLLFIFFFVPINSYPNGSPSTPEICSILQPKHGSGGPQTASSPYKLSLDKAAVAPGEKVKLTISGKEFKGFLAQGRKKDGATAEGSFSPPASGTGKLIKCGHEGSSATHTNNLKHKDLTLEWNVPKEKGVYVIYITIVSDFKTFWVKQPSQDITVE